MSLNFPPQPTHEREIEAALEVLAGVVTGRTAVYLSAPITSGKRFSDWHHKQTGDVDPSHSNHRDAYAREVVEMNRMHARALAWQLRAALPKPLIDPTAVNDLPDWTQDDYRFLWACVIETYIDMVIFIDSWQYSNGCAYEFLTAQRHGIATFDERLQPLHPTDGVRLLREAIAELHARRQPTSFLESVVAELSTLQANAAEETWQKS